MKIELRHTAESSDNNSGEFAVHEGEKEISPEIMASNKHRYALTAGICGVIILGVVVGVLAVVLGGSFKDASAQGSSEAFDFSEVGPGDDSSSTGGSRTSKPTLAVTPSPIQSNPTDPPALTYTGSPAEQASDTPSDTPSAMATNSSSSSPTELASDEPTQAPANLTPEPTMMPNSQPPITAVNYTSPTLLTFCVIADVPYFDNETEALPAQIRDQMEGCEFLVHLGDIMRSEMPCDDEQYIQIKDMMLESKVPAFIIPGDNEWNDCGNNVMVDAAWDKWTNHFTRLEENWNHTIPVFRSLVDYPEIFYFIQKRTLVFGLNIVGGRVHDADEWRTRHRAQAEWVKTIVEMNIPLNADGVIIMAHAKPTEDHTSFFDPLRRLVRDDLANNVPFLYLHGDGHSWVYSRGFLNQPNLLKIQHEGGVRDPILKILSDPHQLGPDVHSAFQYDRQLNLER